MATAYFHVQLTVQPLQGGDANLVLPDVLQSLDTHFVVVREGCQEGIVLVEAPEVTLKKIAKDNRCMRLTREEMSTLRQGYPPPKTKQRYRVASAATASTEAGGTQGSFALDVEGNRIIDTLQTVRSGFYLIDVPIVAVEET